MGCWEANAGQNGPRSPAHGRTAGPGSGAWPPAAIQSESQAAAQAFSRTPSAKMCLFPASVSHNSISS